MSVPKLDCYSPRITIVATGSDVYLQPCHSGAPTKAPTPAHAVASEPDRDSEHYAERDGPFFSPYLDNCRSHYVTTSI